MNYCDEYSLGDKQIEKAPTDIITTLGMVMRSKGLNQRDLSELNGWPTSRTNKIMKGRQNANSKDCRIMARSLGCVIRNRPYGNNGNGDIELLYKVERFGNLFMNLKNCPKEEDERVITEFELPISIVNLLRIEATDFVISSNIGRTMAYNHEEQESIDGGIAITFEQRHIFTGPDKLCFGMLISPERDFVILGIWYFTDKWDEESLEMRFCYKHILDVNDLETKEYDDFAENNTKWFPEKYKFGEIDSLVYPMQEIENAEFIEGEMIHLFTEYCSLIRDALGVDIAENTAGAYGKGFSTLDLYNGLVGNQPIPFNVKQEVLERAKRRCEIDAEHVTFEGIDGKPYMEVVPLIPIITETMILFGQSLNSEANAVCLCPMCAAKLRNGCRDDREDMFVQLYRNQREKLRKMDINVSLTQLLSWNANDLKGVL